MFPDGDFDPSPPAADLADLVEDLELERLWAAMARGDEVLFALARTATLTPSTDPAVITHRQQVLDDCLRDTATVRVLYDLARDAVAAEGKLLRSAFTGRPEPLLNRAVQALELLGGFLRRLRRLAEGHAADFRSAGFTTLFGAIGAELDDGYLREVDALLDQLRFEHGIVATARLGPGNKGVDFVLREPPGKGRDSYPALRKSKLTHTVTGRDESVYRALSELRNRALNEVANAAAQSSDHVRDFFLALRDELGFYLGCVNLAETLAELGVPVCWPEPRDPGEQAWAARRLSEPCLALRLGGAVVGSDVDADGRGLIMVTGPNQGGKSTFLRGLGIAHLMMQCGMFVAADQFRASVAHGVFTHYKREEDATMASGKLDEELARMSAIADRITPGALLLCNESFAATNEREGSRIAAEIVAALTDAGVRVVFVTHLHDLTSRIRADYPDRCLFLRANRRADGSRTFHLTPGEPTPTAHGADLYRRHFG